MNNGQAEWLCCQLGAREHYAIPRALHCVGAKVNLITDFWIDPSKGIRRLFPPRLRERFHPDLKALSVHSFNADGIVFEAASRLRNRKSWAQILDRNRWFQREVVRTLSQIYTDGPTILFAYSYAALEILRFARSKGWKAVLGQIDPGPAEERIVSNLARCHADRHPKWSPAPADYWKWWHEECELADCILVNSTWARSGLVDEGLSPEKIHVVPLAYDAPSEALGFERTYPNVFTDGRPLRVLFLGQINLRKGIAEVFEAIDLLPKKPIEFWFVGPSQIGAASEGRSLGKPQVRWVGDVPRNAVAEFYRNADVFLFPTHSDGFGLTQLEAQAWKLPLIASPNCGSVVTHGRNGFLLNEVNGAEIARVLTLLLEEPKTLVQLSKNAIRADQFGLESLGARLQHLTSS